MKVLPRICIKRMRVTSIMKQIIHIICWLKCALSKKNIKLVFAQRIYIRKNPHPCAAPTPALCEKYMVYSHSATPDQMIRAHNFRFTKLPKSYSSMQFLCIWSFQSVEIPWVSWFCRNDHYFDIFHLICLRVI